MSISRVSDLPTIVLSTLTDEEKKKSLLEISQYHKENIGNTEFGKWYSKSVSYDDIINQITLDSKTTIGPASKDNYGFIKIGKTRDEANYIFPVVLDDDGRAYVEGCEDQKLKNFLDQIQTESWTFVISAGYEKTETITKNIVVSDGEITK